MNELATINNNAPMVAAPATFDFNAMRMLAEAMAASGFFANAKDANKALTIMLVGQEMGIGPAASLNGINVIQGKPQLGANLIAARVKSSGRYDYRVIEMTTERCEIQFLEKGQEIGRSTFTAQEAQTAGYTKNPLYKSNPRNMLFARAMSNGAKWFCPDVFGGVPIYHEGEIEIAQSATPQAIPQSVSATERERNAGKAIKAMGMNKEEFGEFKSRCSEEGSSWVDVALEAEQDGVSTKSELYLYAFDGVKPDGEESETVEGEITEEVAA